MKRGLAPLLALLLAIGAAGCGDDDDDTATTTTEAPAAAAPDGDDDSTEPTGGNLPDDAVDPDDTDDTNDTDEPAAGGASGTVYSDNPDVQAYCEAAEVYAEKLAEVIDDPMATMDLQAEEGAAVMETSQELTTGPLTPDEVDEVGTCTELYTSILAGN